MKINVKFLPIIHLILAYLDEVIHYLNCTLMADMKYAWAFIYEITNWSLLTKGI